MTNMEKGAPVGGLGVAQTSSATAGSLCPDQRTATNSGTEIRPLCQVWGDAVKNRSMSGSGLRTIALAVLGTATFYFAAPRVPGISEFVNRYFCSHPLEYISTAMFFTGIAILMQKTLSVRNEKRALKDAQKAVADGLMTDVQPEDRENTLATWLSHVPVGQKNTTLSTRIAETLQYLRSSGPKGIEEHLRYLAELASERLYQTYATIRTITWAIPILGFLGTVIGITMAIANVTPEQLDSSLGEVTGGLAVAFDTTALALGMSIVLVFAAFGTERSEQQVQNDVEQFGIECILPWFATDDNSSRQVTTGDLARFQAAEWTDQLAALRETWNQVLDQHARQISDVLGEEVQRTLKLHRRDTTDARDAYTNALEASVRSIVDQTEELLISFENRISAWQQAIQQSSQSSVQQSEALHEVGAVLLRMTESEERLVRIQETLNQNLQTTQLANTMEQSANSLTAAVHVLTAKTTGRRAA